MNFEAHFVKLQADSHYLLSEEYEVRNRTGKSYCSVSVLGPSSRPVVNVLMNRSHMNESNVEKVD